MGAGLSCATLFMSNWLSVPSLSLRRSAGDHGYSRVRTDSFDSKNGDMMASRDASLGIGSPSTEASSVIDDTLLDNEELRSLLGVKPSKPEELPGPHMCAMCCTLFSLFGAGFLVGAVRKLVAGALLCTTPAPRPAQFLIYGMLVNEYEYLEISGDREEAASGTLGAAICYIVTAGISIGFWVKGCLARNAALARQRGVDEGDAGSIAFLSHSGPAHARYGSHAGLGTSEGL